MKKTSIFDCLLLENFFFSESLRLSKDCLSMPHLNRTKEKRVLTNQRPVLYYHLLSALIDLVFTGFGTRFSSTEGEANMSMSSSSSTFTAASLTFLSSFFSAFSLTLGATLGLSDFRLLAARRFGDSKSLSVSEGKYL